jgi:choline dehydrogenase
VRGEARIDPGYFSHPEDLETMLHGVQLARRIARGAELAAWGNRALLPGDDVTQDDDIARFIRDNAMTTFHFAGSCRMGDDHASVVDTELCVRGVDGLRVADASVIPMTPVSALNAPSMMLGMRCAQLLRGVLRGRVPELVGQDAEGAAWQS